jgi:hypothetical protein
LRAVLRCSRSPHPTSLGYFLRSATLPEGGPLRAAHRRGDLFKRRQVLMLDWETYCARGEAEDKVVKLSAPYQSTSLSRYDTVS